MNTPVPAHAAPRASAAPRLLVCLGPEERSSFFLPEQWARLEALFPDLLVQTAPPTPEALEVLLRSVEPTILLGSWRLPALPAQRVRIPSLRYFCYLAGSVRRKVPRRLLEEGLLVSNWGSSISRTVAECALLLLLMTLREASHWAVEMHTRHGFKTAGNNHARSLFGRRVGIHGIGAVAKHLVRLLVPFGCEVRAWSEGAPEALFAQCGVQRAPSLEALFATCDAVVEAEALRPENEGCISEAHLRLLGDGVFINIARGELVEEQALLRVAREGRLRVGLDVYHDEPLPPHDPLRGLPNVTLLPHIGGPTPDRRCDSTAFALENLSRFLQGHPPEALLTPETFDRMT